MPENKGVVRCPYCGSKYVKLYVLKTEVYYRCLLLHCKRKFSEEEAVKEE